MEILILRTNIKSKTDFSSIKRNLNNSYQINECTIDIDHLSGLRKDDFSSQKGETFRAFPPDGAPVSLQLIEVADIKPPAGKKRLEAPATSPNPGQECFSLIFQGPPGTTLWQDTFKLVNTQLGQFAMLLVPVGRDSSHTYFQAVINRLTP